MNLTTNNITPFLKTTSNIYNISINPIVDVESLEFINRYYCNEVLKRLTMPTMNTSILYFDGDSIEEQNVIITFKKEKIIYNLGYSIENNKPKIIVTKSLVIDPKNAASVVLMDGTVDLTELEAIPGKNYASFLNKSLLTKIKSYNNFKANKTIAISKLCDLLNDFLSSPKVLENCKLEFTALISKDIDSQNNKNKIKV